jgi:Na+/alanine symporter
MENKVYESEMIWNFSTILGTFVAIFNILLMLLIFYFVFRLYRKVSCFLERKQ